MIEKSNGGWKAKIILDSVSPMGDRLTTMEVRFPRIVLAEFNTHRMFSRNSASSRAIPVERMIKMVEDDPFIPTYWGKNQKGMQAYSELSIEEANAARAKWRKASMAAIEGAKSLLDIGVHKQLANRLLEPFMWHTAIVSATDWSNFFALRCDSAAAPEIRNAALLMRDVYEQSEPQFIDYDGWHLPYIFEEDWNLLAEHANVAKNSLEEIIEEAKKISVARCARVSFLTHDGRRDHTADIILYNRLVDSPPHLSPLEHVATPYKVPSTLWSVPQSTRIGNFRGWKQLRKFFHNEQDASYHLEGTVNA